MTITCFAESPFDPTIVNICTAAAALSAAVDYLNETGKPLVAGKFGAAAVVPSYVPIGRGSPTKARAILSSV
jgi:hypothetical protein